MDPVIRSIRTIRSGLTLQPRKELIQYLESRVLELTENKAPDYAIELAKQAIDDLRVSDREDVLIGRLAEWVRLSTTESHPDKRSVLAQIGAFMMLAK